MAGFTQANTTRVFTVFKPNSGPEIHRLIVVGTVTARDARDAIQQAKAMVFAPIVMEGAAS